MRFWESLSGLYLVEIVSAAPALTLTAVNNSGIVLLDITYTDDLRVKGYVYRKDFQALHELLMYRGEEMTVLKRWGLYWAAQNLRRRPVIVFGILFFLLLVLYLPTRVLFVQIEGNQFIPTKLIEEKSQQCGIFFGASRRDVRSEKTKNALLSAIPELQWAGVNTRGCVAVITVKERSESNIDKSQLGICSVVAARDGVIRDIIALKGNLLCKVGQAVKKDQVLVSGYTDCGISIKAERAEAEISAFTVHQLDVISPTRYCNRSALTKVKTRCSLRFGKNIINLWKDSGISDTTCVKIQNEYALTLPGGFQLPISMMVETLSYYDCADISVGDVEQFGWAESSAAQYLLEQMIAGEITDSAVLAEIRDGAFQMVGRYFCIEMISQVRNEEIVQGDGKTNG